MAHFEKQPTYPALAAELHHRGVAPRRFASPAIIPEPQTMVWALQIAHA
jgi:hypothetical protein